MRKVIGIDLFSGSGGMTLGAKQAGVEVVFAVESDKYAAATYAKNNPDTKLFADDIRKLDVIPVDKQDAVTVLFGGPPCQGFSSSNQRNRGSRNPNNWLFREFIRLCAQWQPDYIVFENVKGITQAEKGAFIENVMNEFSDIGYTLSHEILNSVNFGIPQKRSRLFVIGSRTSVAIKMPSANNNGLVTVRDALSDLPSLSIGDNRDIERYPSAPTSSYARQMRGTLERCSGHIVSRNAKYVVDRYKHIKQGENWEAIPKELMANYTDTSRCHTGIYHRVHFDKPSIVIGNYRKNMLIHPTEDRGLSVREAARIQSFPDWFTFCGSIGFQQQQVGNAVPPLLANAVFEMLVK